MKALKFIFYTTVFIVSAVLVVAFFLPSSYQVERSIEVKATPQQCYDNVADLNHYKNWNPWSRMEPTSEQIVYQPSKGLNAKWSWKGKKIGEGSLTIKKVEIGKNIETHLQFIKPFKSESTGNWQFEKSQSNTKITWGNTGKLDYPIGRIMGLGLKNMLGTDFENGLANLKEYIEKNQPKVQPTSDSLSTAQDSILESANNK